MTSELMWGADYWLDRLFFGALEEPLLSLPNRLE